MGTLLAKGLWASCSGLTGQTGGWVETIRIKLINSKPVRDRPVHCTNGELGLHVWTIELDCSRPLTSPLTSKPGCRKVVSNFSQTVRDR